MKNILRKTLLSTILLTTLGWTADITSWKSNYDTNSDVWIELKDKPGNAQDWIGIYKSGSDNSWSNVIKWRWANDTTPTQVDKGDWYKFHLDDGKYEARFFLNNSFTVEESISFSVGEQNNEPSIKLSKSIYQENEKLSINLDNLPSNNGDWVGVYAKGTSNDWGNVLRWSYTNGTKSMNKDGIEKGTLTLDGLDAGAYEARLFYNNTFDLVKKVGFSVNQNNNNSVTIGARKVQSTPVNKGTLFASPNGHGDCLSKESACDIYSAMNKLSHANNILFLLAGTYDLLDKKLLFEKRIGTVDKPFIIESFDKNNKAVLTGNNPYEVIKVYQSKYLQFRNLEIKDATGFGIRVRESSYIKIEGCEVYGNKKSGISLYGSSNNLIKDNITYNNKDIDKGNADGIQIEIMNIPSKNNQILHNTVYGNSDDGIDTIAGVNTTIKYNISYANLGEEGANGGTGNGIGIKACGKIAKGSIVEHNIVFGNGGNGIECYGNNGHDVIFAYNTSYNNGRNNPEDLYHGYGFGLPADTNVALHHNISSDNKLNQLPYGIQNDNSWETNEKVPFVSTNIKSKDFLKPQAGSDFENMGAYAK